MREHIAPADEAAGGRARARAHEHTPAAGVAARHLDHGGVPVSARIEEAIGLATSDDRQVARRPGPRFVESTLQIDVEIQKKGVAAGTWTAGEFKQKFVCAQVSKAVWNCVDAGGRATLEVTLATEIKVCYLDNREGAQGAGCALLRRAG